MEILRARFPWINKRTLSHGTGFFIRRAPGRAHLLDGDGETSPKSITHPTGGSVSRTARVSIARWNLKEAAGKALARRTGSVSGVREG